jgi:hypothetical protein
VEKREINIPLEIQKQAVKLDEDVFHVVATAVGPWQQRLNELGGVKPLAFGQYDELAPRDSKSSSIPLQRRMPAKQLSGTSSTIRFLDTIFHFFHSSPHQSRQQLFGVFFEVEGGFNAASQVQATCPRLKSQCRQPST